jgi:hypothetical protein
MLSHKQTSFTAKDISSVVAPVAAALGMIMIVNMPLRDPYMPSKNISPVFSKPTVQLRTPEDNLTPWQYMSVSWMEPLIKKGVTRQMYDEDIWDLGWEFKHARLHNAFTALPGSVTKRVFLANGMDLVRTTAISVYRKGTSKYRPWLFQPIRQVANSTRSSHARTATAPARFNVRS